MSIRIRVKFKLSDTGLEHTCETNGLEGAYDFKREIERSPHAKFVTIEALYPFFIDWTSLKDLPDKIRRYKKQSFFVL